MSAAGAGGEAGSERSGSGGSGGIGHEPPTTLASVVWSRGHAFVLEETSYGRMLWAGVDDRCRPLLLTCTELQRRGWSLTR